MTNTAAAAGPSGLTTVSVSVHPQAHVQPATQGPGLCSPPFKIFHGILMVSGGAFLPGLPRGP